jgi:hypothetical protein
MLSWLRGQVGMQDEFAGIHAELFAGSKLGGILRARREVDRGDIETLHLDHSEPRGDQGFVRRRVGIDVQTISHTKVKIDLSRMARRNIYLLWGKELDRGIA